MLEMLLLGSGWLMLGRRVLPWRVRLGCAVFLGGEPTNQPHAEVVGSLLYLMTCTRPDLAQPVGASSRFVSDPRTGHWEAAVKVLRYVVGTLDLGLQFCGKTQDMVG
jgi:hypothetical protein